MTNKYFVLPIKLHKSAFFFLALGVNLECTYGPTDAAGEQQQQRSL